MTSYYVFVYLSSFQMPDGEDAPLERNSHFITKDDDIEEGNLKKIYQKVAKCNQNVFWSSYGRFHNFNTRLSSTCTSNILSKIVDSNKKLTPQKHFDWPLNLISL